MKFTSVAEHSKNHERSNNFCDKREQRSLLQLPSIAKIMSEAKITTEESNFQISHFNFQLKKCISKKSNA